MAKSPVPSLVVKTAKPTQAQKQAQIVQRAQALEGGYRAGLPTPGGNLAPVRIAPSGATVGQSSKPPIAPNYGGSVKTLTDAKPLPRPAANPAGKPPVKVTVHPNGKIEVHQAAPATTTTPAAPKAAHVNLGPDTPGPKAPDIRTGPAKPKPQPRVQAGLGEAPAPLSIEQQAQNILDPVKQSILDAINARLTAQQGAITSYSKDLAQMMGQYGPAAQAAYGTAQTGQAAVDAALAQTLTGAGNAGQAALAGKLAQIDADPGTVARLNAAAAGATQGAASAAAGRGAASLSDLISRGASAADYGAKLPGVAGLYGLQATKSAQSQGTTDTANAVSQLEQQLPSIVNQIRTNQQQQAANETTRALAATQALGKAPAWAAKILGVPPGTPSASVRTANTRATAAAGKVDATLSKAYGVQMNSQGEPIIGKNGKPIAYPTAAASTPKVDLPLSKAYGVLMDNTGTPITRQGKTIPLPRTAKSSSGGLTVKQIHEYHGEAATIARNAFNGFTDAKGASHPPLTLGGAMQEMRQSGIPTEIARVELARWYDASERKRLQGN